MDEITFQKSYELTRGDINLAINSFYSWLEINNVAASNKHIYRAINETSIFWNMNLYGLQSTLFIALGRIFDDGRDSHSIHKYLASCITNCRHFSYESLRERKKEVFKSDIEGLNKYMERTFQPEVSDFRELKRELSKHRRRFNEIYKDIRDYVFAHNIANSPGESENLFSRTLISDIEEMLAFLYDLIEVTWELFNNGKKPVLGRKDYDYKDRITDDVRKSLNMLVSSGIQA